MTGKVLGTPPMIVEKELGDLQQKRRKGRFVKGRERPVLSTSLVDTRQTARGSMDGVVCGELRPVPWERGSNPERNKSGYVGRGRSQKTRWTRERRDQMAARMQRIIDGSPRAMVQTEGCGRVNRHDAEIKRGKYSRIPETSGHPGYDLDDFDIL